MCSQRRHQIVKRSCASFANLCENHRDWPGEDLVVAECRRCHSTLAVSARDWYRHLVAVERAQKQAEIDRRVRELRLDPGQSLSVLAQHARRVGHQFSNGRGA